MVRFSTETVSLDAAAKAAKIARAATVEKRILKVGVGGGFS
jgi:hypothetical protein